VLDIDPEVWDAEFIELVRQKAKKEENERCMTLAIHRAQEYFKVREDDYGYAVSQFAEELRRTAPKRE